MERESSRRLSLTVLMPMGNEERHARAALESAARVADEILVVDSFSTDATPAIVEEFRARLAASGSPALRFIQHEYVNSATQKNWAIPKAAHEWVMVLDADERIPEALAAEIRAFLAVDGPAARGEADGLRIRRTGYFLGQEVRYSGWQKDSVLRVFPRDRGRYIDREVHADVEIAPRPEGGASPARVVVARARMPHYTFEGFEPYMRKFDAYTTRAAGDRARKTPRVGFIHLFGRPAWRFFRQYFLDLGILDGRVGFIICGLSAFSVFLKYAKLLERQVKPGGESPGVGEAAGDGR